MKFILPILGFIFLFQGALCYGEDTPPILTTYCQAKGGELMTSWICPASQEQRSGPWCKLKDPVGKDLIFNGCTGAIGPYTSIFFKACVLHDLCYHNEPASTGKQKSDCDKKFLSDMDSICSDNGNGEICETAAEAFFYVVLKLGDASWSCSKGDASYPTSMNAL